MNNIRKANLDDLSRISEIYIFNYRINFYPIFKDEQFYFSELTVLNLIDSFTKDINHIHVYDDGVIKGFIHTNHQELKKLFVEPVFQNQGIGSILINYAINELDVHSLWALEKNTKAIDFYQSHGFDKTNIKKLEEGTSEYLIYFKKETNYEYCQ